MHLPVKIRLCFMVHCTLYMCMLLCFARAYPAVAQDVSNVPHNIDSKHSSSLTDSQRISLAQSFLSKIKTKLQAFDAVRSSGESAQKNILPDGETLLLQPILGRSIRPDGLIVGYVHNQKYYVSVTDFSDVLQLSIQVDPEAQTATGWYINENKEFNLSAITGTVNTDKGSFNARDAILVRENDIWVETQALSQWLGVEALVNVGTQELNIKSRQPFPIEQRLNRRKTNFVNYKVPDPTLPRIDDNYKLAAVPVIDVSTTSRYSNPSGDGEAQRSHAANIRTVGDLGKGTLTTQSLLNDVDQVAFVRATYKQETVDGHLLGPLKAKKFELGDVATVDTPLGGFSSQELGVRVTNTDVQRRFSQPFTNISGNAIPGWDVELYRNEQLLNFQQVGDDGFYQFDDINLFQNDNNFRLLFYGPQGEIIEENLFVPYDNTLSTQGQGIYDVSLTLDDVNTYRTARARADDAGGVNFAVQVEKPILPGTTLKGSLRSLEQDQGDERENIATVGVSTSLAQTLINADSAIDEDGDMAAELVVSRDFVDHEFRNTLRWASAEFDDEDAVNYLESDVDTYRNSFALNGPLIKSGKFHPRYSLGVDYSWDENGEDAITSSAGLNFGVRNVSFNGLVRNTQASNQEDQTNASVSMLGIQGKNRLRLSANYNIDPDSELSNVLASYRRYLNDDLDLELGIRKDQRTSITEYEAQLDWQAGFARISPSIRYNSEQDFFAGLNTRFGIVKDPSNGKLRMFENNLTSFGMLSAFVYLDKDGNGKFDGDDEPLDEVKVATPQNGNGMRTNDQGYAFFTRMTRLRLTDVYIDAETLKDPAWIPGFTGVSVMPREGYVAEVEFPIHMAGELDGTVFAKAVELPPEEQGIADDEEYTPPRPVAMRNVKLTLYNQDGHEEQSSVTDMGGFYYFTKIPPGRYLLIIDEDSAAQKHFIRPQPQQIEIGYDGTLIFGNDIFVETGDGDVPSKMLSGLDTYKERHPHIDFSKEDQDKIVLNLGEYNSRVMMSVVWYKIKTRFAQEIAGGDLYVPPAESFADVGSGKHILRVGFADMDLPQAYDVCRKMQTQDQACEVEILPAYMKQADAREAQTVSENEELANAAPISLAK